MDTQAIHKIIAFIREIYHTSDFIPLHEPRFLGNEKKYVADCIDSTYVSSVGHFVNEFERIIASYTEAQYAIATVNGTSALHVSLRLLDVGHMDEVITQPLTFVATCNAISYCGAAPIFVDVDKDTMGLSPKALEQFLEQHTEIKQGQCHNKKTGKKIKACIPMHTFGHPCYIKDIVEICSMYGIAVLEDAAESLGSRYLNQHTGTFGALGVLSFNGNKIITSGGGGAILTNDKALADRAKHVTTTAKVPHVWEFMHDELGYNYRMPNLNAALLVAQLEKLDVFLKNKRELATLYKDFFDQLGVSFMTEPQDSHSNYWLNAITLPDKVSRDACLKEMNAQGIMARPIWKLMQTLPMFSQMQSASLENASWLADRVVNIPSSVRL